jgi:hypothetical protein
MVSFFTRTRDKNGQAIEIKDGQAIETKDGKWKLGNS